MKKNLAIFFALGVEFTGLVVGGAISGELLGKKIGMQEGVGASAGAILGFFIAVIFTAQILKKLNRDKK